jgi:hypothetical protein
MLAVRLALVLVLALLSSSAHAQVVFRPTPEPLTSAAGADWYDAGTPIPFAGNLYYPSGPLVFFDGNRMVPTGAFGGVVLYADTTVEPYSIVLVPIGRGLLRPYERPRTGDLAGTTGSRPSSIPSSPGVPRAAVDHAGEPRLALPGASDTSRDAGEVAPDDTQFRSSVRDRVISVHPPERNIGIWIEWRGQRWVATGQPVRLSESALAVIGEYDGVPVFARATRNPDVVYLPAIGGLVAAYERSR